ncbi:Sodium/iodide co-transporter [hydrothermal vent metagenome]|uniref:Sodium/iodide co-transporter n=1 Tax=hydrothermal vent metagenome TaxID=652676 RepID=A0A3B0VY44_9ZZZZ
MQQTLLSPEILILVIASYFLLLYLISIKTSKAATNMDFYNGSKQSPWFVVAFGMIGATLSGVTFISIPGWVYNTQFAYMQMVMGYVVGYMVIMLVLLPLYYRRNLISIYGYLNQRFGFYSHKTGAAFFILSRVIGASFRLYLVTMVLHDFIFIYYGIPFWVTVLVSLLLIWSYTVKAGIKTIIWTDTLQTFFMIAAVVIAVLTIASQLQLDLSSIVTEIKNSDYSRVFFFDGGWSDKNNFFKQFIAGAFLAIVMTGLDQDMMQKNLSCKNLAESQKNIRWFTLILVLVNILFLGLGALLYIYAGSLDLTLPTNAGGTAVVTDKVFPWLAFNHMPVFLGIIFLVGLLAAAYSSADSALTSLTTSYCIDILDKENSPKATRMRVHLGFTLVLFATIIVFRYLLESSVIHNLFTLAGYTYGPLLGMFAFGLITKKQIKDKAVPIIAVTAPVLTFFIDKYSSQLFAGYQFGFELLLLNGLIMFLGLLCFVKNKGIINPRF